MSDRPGWQQSVRTICGVMGVCHLSLYRHQPLVRPAGAAGRLVFGTGASAPIDVPLADGDELPFWGGLRVVHLPGHTLGHCGFYSARHDVLFSGDLFASGFFNATCRRRS